MSPMPYGSSIHCGIRQRFRRYYLPADRPGEVKLDQDDATRICQRVVDHDLDTGFDAEQFEISRRRVQQLVKQYRDTGEIPQLETPGRKPFAEYPPDLEDRILALHQHLGAGAEAISHVLRVRDGLSIATNRVHAILQEYDHVSENPNKQGQRRPWVRFERKYAGVTIPPGLVHQRPGRPRARARRRCPRYVFEMIETDSSSAAASVDLLDSVREDWLSPVPILEVITDHGSEFANIRQKERLYLDHAFEGYLHDNDIKHTLGKVGQPQSNGKIERFYQTYEKHRWRLGTLDAFLAFYRGAAPHEPRLGQPGDARRGFWQITAISRRQF